jgi:hypothetical protein
MRFGGELTLNGLVMYLASNGEKVLLGRFWGAEALGIYGRAYQLIRIPTDNLNSAVGDVAFSALSRIQGEPNRLRSYFLKGYSLVLALTVPVTISCALFADDTVLVLYLSFARANDVGFRDLEPAWVAALLDRTGRTRPQDCPSPGALDGRQLSPGPLVWAKRRCICIFGDYDAVDGSWHPLVHPRHGDFVRRYRFDGEPSPVLGDSGCRIGLFGHASVRRTDVSSCAARNRQCRSFPHVFFHSVICRRPKAFLRGPFARNDGHCLERAGCGFRFVISKQPLKFRLRYRATTAKVLL